MRLYFGHPINSYGIPLEYEIVAAIPRMVLPSVVVNPNQPEHDAGYRRFKQECGNGMRYFYEEVLPSCAGGVFLPFGDGAWGAGVAGEALFLFRRHRPVWVIRLLKFPTHGFLLYPILQENEIKALSIEETRARVYMPDHTIRPFA